MRATVRSSSSRISASSSTTSTLANSPRGGAPPCLQHPTALPKKTKIGTRPRPLQFELGAIRFAQLARNVETQTGTTMMCGKERLEDLFAASLINALTVVNHMQFHLIIGPGITNQQANAAGSTLRMPQRVAQKVPQHLMKMRTIETKGGPARQLQADHICRQVLLDQVFLDEQRQVFAQVDLFTIARSRRPSSRISLTIRSRRWVLSRTMRSRRSYSWPRRSSRNNSPA
jgi:hypothetical protein